MPWWGWVIIWAVLTVLVILFVHGGTRNNRAADRAAAEHFGYEYKEEG